MFLFQLASRHMTWLGERQSITAVNIANADTPGYRTKQIAPFSSFVEEAGSQLAVTSPDHIPNSSARAAVSAVQPGGNWGSSHSGNNVSLENELMASGSTSRMMGLDSSLVRSFHRMFLGSVRA